MFHHRCLRIPHLSDTKAPFTYEAVLVGGLRLQDERILNEKRRAHTLPFDIQPVPGATVSELSISRFEEEYLPQAFSAEILEANDRSMSQRLATTKMIASADDQTATVLGLLVLGKRPRDVIPNSYIQFLRGRGGIVGSRR